MRTARSPVAAAILSLWAVCAVAPAVAQSGTDQSATDARTLSVAAPWEIASLDPATHGYVLQRMQVVETLVDAGADGVLRPGLATAWETSEDGLVWRFALREEVAFHDGTAFDPEAVVTALDRARGEPGALADVPLERVEAGDGEVVLTLSEPFAALPAFLANYASAILAPASFDADGRSLAAIGTGPYAVERFAPPLTLDVVRHDGYWGEAPAIERASYGGAGRAETRALLAESGQGDLVFTIDPSGAAQLREAEGVTLHSVAIPRVVSLKVNAGHPFLDDPRARRAIDLAIDRAGIAAGILRAPEAAANQLFAPVLSAWHDPTLAPAERDLERAAALLAELGWEPGDDGTLVRDGEPFRLELRTFTDRPELPLIAAALQAQLGELGIDVDVAIGNSSDIPAGHADGTLELALLARNFGLTPDPIGTALADFTGGGGDWGAMNWQRDDVDEALRTVAANADPEARAEPIRTVREALAEELPVIPIAWYQHTVASSDRIENLTVDPLERSYGIAALRWADDAAE